MCQSVSDYLNDSECYFMIYEIEHGVYDSYMILMI